MKKTSVKACKQLIKSGKLSPRKGEVLTALAKSGPMTATEVSMTLGVPRDSVSPRIAELRRNGLVKTTKTTTCDVTGKTVSVWETTGQTRLKKTSTNTAPMRWYLVCGGGYENGYTVSYLDRAKAESVAERVNGYVVEAVECR